MSTPPPEHNPCTYPFQTFRQGLAVLTFVTLLAFLPLNRAGPIWDDKDYITDNAAVQETEGLARIWLEPGSCPYYYPVTFTAFWLEARFFGERPEGYHTVSVLLHAANACLAAWILLQLGVTGAWVGAAFFALHPVQVATVGWITEQKNLIATFWYLLSLAAYLRYFRNGGLGIYVLSLLLFVLSLLSKPVGCTLPVALLLIGWWKQLGDKRRIVVSSLPFFAVSLAVSIFTWWWEKSVIRVEGTAYDFSLLERVLIAGRAACFYLGKLFWPYPLGPLYEKWDIDTGAAWQYAFPWGVLLGLVALWIGRRRWGRGPFVAVSYYLVTVAPFLGFLSFSGMIYAFVFNHHQYTAVLGPAALAGAWFTTLILRKKAFEKPLSGLLLALLCVCAALTFRQSIFYRSEIDLWSENVRTVPRSPSPRNYLGRALLNEGRFEEAFGAISETLKEHPDEPESHFLMASILASRGNPNRAFEHLERAVATDPNFSNARFNLAMALASRGRKEEAAREFSELLKRRPSYWSAYVPYSQSLLALGRKDEAIAALEEAFNWPEAEASAHRQLGTVLAKEGRFEESFQHFEEAIREDPNQAHRVKPDYAEAVAGYGEDLLANGETNKACEQFERALEIWPRAPRAKEVLESISGAGE